MKLATCSIAAVPQDTRTLLGSESAFFGTLTMSKAWEREAKTRPLVRLRRPFVLNTAHSLRALGLLPAALPDEWTAGTRYEELDTPGGFGPYLACVAVPLTERVLKPSSLSRPPRTAVILAEDNFGPGFPRFTARLISQLDQASRDLRFEAFVTTGQRHHLGCPLAAPIPIVGCEFAWQHTYPTGGATYGRELVLAEADTVTGGDTFFHVIGSTRMAFGSPLGAFGSPGTATNSEIDGTTQFPLPYVVQLRNDGSSPPADSVTPGTGFTEVGNALHNPGPGSYEKYQSFFDELRTAAHRDILAVYVPRYRKFAFKFWNDESASQFVTTAAATVASPGNPSSVGLLLAGSVPQITYQALPPSTLAGPTASPTYPEDWADAIAADTIAFFSP